MPVFISPAKREERERKILELYLEGNHTLEEIGKVFKISRQRVHQLLAPFAKESNLEKIAKRNTKIVEIYSTGKYTPKEIGNMFGLTDTRINCLIPQNIKEDVIKNKTPRQIRNKRFKGRYRGVYYNHGVYTARIYLSKKIITLGSFPTEIQAAQAYNQAAIQYFGEHANLNHIPEYERVL